MRTFARIVWAAGATLLLSHAVAQGPVDGTEVMVTDPAGHQLVGFGVVKSGLLMLRLGGSGGNLLVLLVGPDGTVESFEGARGAGGALLVDLSDGTRESLGAYLGRNGVALRIVSQKGGPSGPSAASVSDGGGGTSSDESSGSTSGDSSGGSEEGGVGIDVGTDGH